MFQWLINLGRSAFFLYAGLMVVFGIGIFSLAALGTIVEALAKKPLYWTFVIGILLAAVFAMTLPIQWAVVVWIGLYLFWAWLKKSSKPTSASN